MADPVLSPRETLNDYFHSITAHDGEYLIYDDGYRPRSYSYQDLTRAAGNFAARLEASGIGRGDKVILWSENRPEWVAAFWGCVLRGVAVTPVDERHSLDFLGRIAGAVQPKAILIGEEVELPAGFHPAPAWRLAELDWTSTLPYTETGSGAGDAVEILFTSGATAEPKGVVITHRNILSNVVPVETEVRKYARYARPFHPIRFLNLLPLSHMFGQAMAIFIPPMLGGVVIFQRSQSPQEVVRQIKSRRISVLVCVPKILEVLKEYVVREIPAAAVPAPPGTGPAARWWRFRAVHRMFGLKFWSMIVGGAALDPALEAFWGGLGFAVIQGYGLTEAAPIVTLNHPFHARRGTVGKPIAGVQIRIADDGEVLVRGGNVTTGYYNNSAATAEAFHDGWFHTGDIGELDDSGRLILKGRKKEMIILADGRNVFPEDVERVLNAVPGVRDSAAVGVQSETGEQVHAALVLEHGVDPEAVVRAANAGLEDHQRVRGYTVWPDTELPRTEGTAKLKRREIRSRISGQARPDSPAKGSPLEAIIGRFAGGRAVNSQTTLDELGLSSLERVELLVALEQKLGVTLDEAAFGAVKTVADLDALRHRPPAAGAPPETFEFPRWNRALWARWHRVVHLNFWILPLARIFAWVRVAGREHLDQLTGPALIASNHQGYFDTPILFIAMPWKWRHLLAPVMRKEFFDAHFNRKKYGWGKWFTNSLNYYLACLTFNAVPIPQREAGARQTLHYLGELVEEGWCPLIFPEGKHSADESILPFQGGVAMMASRLRVPVVPVRIRGSNRVLHPEARFPTPGRVSVSIGKPLILEGEDFASLTRRLEQAIRSL